jgi:hypothetical protein
MSYKDDLVIDKHRLDEELMSLSVKFSSHAEDEVEAEFQVNKAKSKLDLTKAKLDNRIRSQAEASGKKITENFISNTIIQDQEYQQVLEEYHLAVKTQASLDVGRKSFEYHKKALDRLVDLFLSNYWAEPRGRAEQVIQSKAESSHIEALNQNPRLIKRRQRQEEE